MGYKLNSITTEGLPEHIVRIFTRAFDVPTFVETGTAGSGSVQIASDIFKKVITIELVEGRAVDFGLENVEYLTGDSVHLLPLVLSKLNGEYVFFFLDAHFSDSVPNTTEFKECPVLDELKVISKYQRSIILIDDARLFFGHPPYPADPRDWPTIEQIFLATRNLFPRHHTTIVDDYVLIFPDEMGDAVSEEWRKRFSIRYPSPEDKLKEQVKDVYKALNTYMHGI